MFGDCPATLMFSVSKPGTRAVIGLPSTTGRNVQLQADVLHRTRPAADDLGVLGLHGPALAFLRRLLAGVAGGLEEEDIVRPEFLEERDHTLRAGR